MSKYILATLVLSSLSSAAVLAGSNVNEPYVPANAPKHGSSPGFVSLTLARKTSKPLKKRQSPDPLQNDISGYSVEITLGTPPQIQWVNLDTGSNELWIPGASSTSHNLGKPFSIQYGIGTVAGTYSTDNMTMGGASISQQQFGDASTSQQISQGILGIAWGNGVDTNYNNVIDNLKAQGVTASRAFGLNLGSIDNPTGEIIFGGIDIMKYSGPLQKQPIIPRNLAPDGYARYWFYMNQVSITPPGASAPIALTPSTYNQPMFPDSGSAFCQLPSALFAALLAYFPVDQVNQGSSTYTVSCNYRTQAGYINFAFGEVTVSVSYHEFIWFDGVQCWFAAQPSTQFYLLGDSFMRSAYIVYDQDNSNILIAPAANCGTSIIPISTGVNAVPSINGVCAPTYTPPVASISPTGSPSPTLKTSNSFVTSTNFATSSSRLTTSSSVPISKKFPSSALLPVSTSTKLSSSTALPISISSRSTKYTTSSSSKLSSSSSSGSAKVFLTSFLQKSSNSLSTHKISSSSSSSSTKAPPTLSQNQGIISSSTLKPKPTSTPNPTITTTKPPSSSSSSSCFTPTIQITLPPLTITITITLPHSPSIITIYSYSPLTVIQPQIQTQTVYVTRILH
ncbi:hypothetical protein EG329_010900 [Mollisiaceae sp. DMI_Dod_QoI]|nr:hypothetical protein EG329_010900 [Helotiales sp. DMI_Dod_QoI]